MTSSVRSAVRFEHRLTHPTATLIDLESAVALAAEHDLAALTVNPWLVRAAKRLLGRTAVRLATVVGHPDGTQLHNVKAFEASQALEHGASQIDCVMNAGALASGDDDTAYADMLAVIDMAHSALATAGVIVEPAPLDDELVRRACRLAERAGADCVVTGAATVRTAVARVRLLRDSVGARVQVKAAGRFRSADEIEQVAAAGASRVSLELTPQLASELFNEAPLAAAR